MYKKLFFLCVLILQTFVEAKPDYLIPSTKKITIFWDTSLSMRDKDLDKEINLLENYFYNIPNVEVKLVTFSNTINLQKSFTIVNSDWNQLKEELLAINYDGVAFYDVLLEDTTSDINFLFTDGIEVIDKLLLNDATPTYVINSSKKANFKVLIKQSVKSKGKYINLLKRTIQEALIKLNINDAKILKVSPKLFAKQRISNTNTTLNNNKLEGIVYGSEGVLVGATITINGKTLGVVTDDKGKFNLKVNKGDILVVSFLGKKTKEILVEALPTIEILLVSNENELDEVVVKAKKTEEISNTGFGKKEKKKLGYAVQSISSKDLPEGRDDNLSVHGKFSGVTSYGGSDDISQMVLRANSILLNVYPLIVIDGTPIKRSSSVGSIQLSSFINPSNIANITLLKGLAATNRWGGEGSNGVILITTKTALVNGKQGDKLYDQALLRDNNFTENLSLVVSNINEKYIEELKEFKTLNEVYAHYLKQRVNYLDDPLYFVNISDYVLQFGNKELASKILSNCLEINVGTIETLKLVAYKVEKNQDFFLAKQIYEKIAILKPRDAQSYRDLALIYQETGYYQKALSIYKKIQNNNYEGVDFSGIHKVVTNEMSRLILQHSNELDLSDVAEHYLKDLDYDARIVFEYNDNIADFELQFVNPQKKFFTWSHTKAENEMRLYEEKEQGFNTEEFLLIDAEKGEWQINIENKMPQSKKPFVIKYTVYRNFGKTNETKEIKILILNTIKGKQMVGKISI